MPCLTSFAAYRAVELTLLLDLNSEESMKITYGNVYLILNSGLQEVCYQRVVTLGVDIYKPTAASDPRFNYNINPPISAKGANYQRSQNNSILPSWGFRSCCRTQNRFRLALEHRVLNTVPSWRQDISKREGNSRVACPSWPAHKPELRNLSHHLRSLWIPLRSLSAQNQALIHGKGSATLAPEKLLGSELLSFLPTVGGPHGQGSAESPGARLGAQRGPAGAASARPPARSGGVEARVAQPALQRELSAALGSLCSQQRRLRHSVETETSGGDARTGSDRRAASQGGQVGCRDRAGWRMGSPRGVGQGPTPIPHGDPARCARGGGAGTPEKSGRGSRGTEIACRLRLPASGVAEGTGRAAGRVIGRAKNRSRGQRQRKENGVAGARASVAGAAGGLARRQEGGLAGGCVLGEGGPAGLWRRRAMAAAAPQQGR